MSKEIWKFPINLHESISYVSMPIDAEILDIDIQLGKIQVWAIVDPNVGTENRSFSIYGTGQRIDMEGKKYLKTVQADGGIFVWHIFEIAL